MTTFDLTFDETFRGLAVGSAPVSAYGCRKPGVFLSWLGPFGPCYHHFAGFADRTKQSSGLGSVKRGGLLRDTRKETAQTITARATLTEKEAEVVTTIFESVAVYVLAPTADGKIVQVPVRVEPGESPEWKESENRLYLDVKVILPARKSQRI